MIIPKKQRSRIHRIAEITMIVIIFLVAFVGGWAVMHVVYGFDFANSTAYNEVMNATQNAATYALNANLTR